MLKGINKARKQAKKAIEGLYEHTCNIRRYEQYKDPETKETKTGLQPKYDNQPCRVSKQSLSKNNQSDTVNQIAYETKLFINPGIEIKQGDEIEVTQLDITTKYTAGEAFKYATHQEIILQRIDKA